MAKPFRRRGRIGLLAGASLVASAAALVLSSGVPAQAATPSGNTVIVGSGSNTAYPGMNLLDNLFNTSQGCDELATSSQTQSLNFTCEDPATGLPAANGENPLNDVALQEPPIGGTNGLKQLEGQTPVLCAPSNANCTAAAPVSFATTVRNPVSTDPQGLNFVNYAKDAISWLHFTEVKGVKTASSSITNLTIPDLANIWNGTYKNWDQIPGVSGGNAPICVYVTDTGSGLYGLWQTDLGVSPLNGYVNSLTTLAGCKTPSGVSYATSHTIEQNEDASIIKNGDEANAIFFFSNGRFQQTCKTVCGGTAVGGSGKSAAVLSEINGVALTNANILSGLWPTPVFLSNVYSDGSNGAIPKANQATLNYVSEQGFICKPQTSGGKNIIDPITNVWYHTEIDKIYTTEGDVPLTLGKEGTVTHPAVLSSPYSGYDSSGTNPSGYCRVATTDGNS